MTNFDVAFNYLVLEDEGAKFTNDPKDSGGPTKWGITIGTFNEFFGVEATLKDIEEMSAATAKQIYHFKYWTPLSCGAISDLGFAVAIFDSGVLYGVGTIALIVQRVLAAQGKTIKLDGILGDKSVGLLNELLVGGGHDAHGTLMQSICGLLHERIDAIIVANPKDERYRRGWGLRADRLLQLLNDEFLNKYKEELFS